MCSTHIWQPKNISSNINTLSAKQRKGNWKTMRIRCPMWQFNWRAICQEPGTQINHKKYWQGAFKATCVTSSQHFAAKKQGIFDNGLVHIDITIILERLKCLTWSTWVYSTWLFEGVVLAEMKTVGEFHHHQVVEAGWGRRVGRRFLAEIPSNRRQPS